MLINQRILLFTYKRVKNYIYIYIYTTFQKKVRKLDLLEA